MAGTPGGSWQLTCLPLAVTLQLLPPSVGRMLPLCASMGRCCELSPLSSHCLSSWGLSSLTQEGSLVLGHV